MADTDGAASDQDLEAPEEEYDEHATLLHISKYFEAKRMQPWAQWSFKEKANFIMDRIFLGFLVIFFLVLMGECVYKTWYVTNLKKIALFVSDSMVFLSDWLFTQDRQEELLEL